MFWFIVGLILMYFFTKHVTIPILKRLGILTWMEEDDENGGDERF